MIAALKAELLKLLTVRSTYVIITLALIADIFFAGFVRGYKLTGPELANMGILQEAITIVVSVTAVFGAIVSILLMSHEYRYNTILYSLTSNKSRTVFLAAKIIVITVFSLLLTTVIAAAAPLLTQLGVHIAGNTLAAQSIAYGDIVWRCLFYGWGYAMMALVLSALIRNQIGTIMTFFIVPSTVEGILSIFLKNNSSYLPFSSLGSVIDKSAVLSHGQAAAVFLVYLIAGWIIAWILFLKKDAN